MSDDSPKSKQLGQHYRTLNRSERVIVLDWLAEIGVAFGKGKKDDPDVEYGVTNRHIERKLANLIFFERLQNWLPKYPWAFHPPRKARGLLV